MALSIITLIIKSIPTHFLSLSEPGIWFLIFWLVLLFLVHFVPMKLSKPFNCLISQCLLQQPRYLGYKLLNSISVFNFLHSFKYIMEFNKDRISLGWCSYACIQDLDFYLSFLEIPSDYQWDLVGLHLFWKQNVKLKPDHWSL